MGKTPKPKPDEDPDQSKRFLEVAREMQSAGELNPTEGERVLDALVKKTAARAAKEG